MVKRLSVHRMNRLFPGSLKITAIGDFDHTALPLACVMLKLKALPWM